MGKPFSQIGLDRSLPHIGVIMETNNASVYPKYELPVGFSFSQYKQGFEEQWASLQYEIENVDSIEEAKTIFKREFLDGKITNWINKAPEDMMSVDIEKSSCYNTMIDKMIFVLDADNNLAGTGSIWDGNMFGKGYQRLHWIAVSPQYQGKGIAKAIVSKLLDIYNSLGYSGYIYLTSQTWSYKALNIYMEFGFSPYMGVKPQNWHSVNLVSGNFEPWDYEEKILKRGI